MGKAALAEVRGRRACGERFLQDFAAARAELLQSLTRFLGSGHDAQDVLQEAFLKCWRCRERIAEVRNLRGWIFRVALNTARDQVILAAGATQGPHVDLAGTIGRAVLASLMPARRARTSPRAVKRAISKYNARGKTDRTTRQATIEVTLLPHP